jgi:hypothetical protein
LALVGAGFSCQTPSTRPGPRAPQFFFYPPAPETPRVQYLRAFQKRKDVAGQQPYSWVDVLVGPSETDQDSFIKPYGIAVDRGRFYVCDTVAGMVWYANFQSGGFGPIPGDAAQGKLKKPINIKIDPADGRRYVTDVGRLQIVVFGPDDQYVTAFSMPDGLQPNDVAIAGDRLYVAAAPIPSADVDKPADSEIQARDKRTGQVIQSFGSIANTPREEAVGIPISIAVDPGGNVLVSDAGGFRVLVYSPDGKFVTSFGSIGRAIGQLSRPRGITVDREGRIYLVDAAMERVFMYGPDHQMLMWFGEPEAYRPTALVLPAQVAIDYQNVDYFRKYLAAGQDLEFVVWVTNQGGPRPVSCYGFLRSTTPQQAARE